MSGYGEWDEARQVAALEPVARAAADGFGLEVQRIEAVRHSYNTTFRVDTPDGAVALRLGTNSPSTTEHAIAQQSWIEAIGGGSEVLVPVPVRAADGAWCLQVDAPPLGRALLATAARWLDAPDLEQLEPTTGRLLGRAMAQLHLQSEDWALPEGGGLPTFLDPLFGDADVLDAAPGIDADDRAVLAAARERAAAAFARALAAEAPRAIHADLHGGNLKLVGDRLAVFDFDDAGFGVRALDLAISTFYLRRVEPAVEAAVRDGYAEVAPLPAIDEADAEALVVGRQLLLANDLLGSSTAELRAMSVTYTGTAIARLRRWLDTGTFSLDPR